MACPSTATTIAYLRSIELPDCNCPFVWHSRANRDGEDDDERHALHELEECEHVLDLRPHDLTIEQWGIMLRLYLDGYADPPLPRRTNALPGARKAGILADRADRGFALWCPGDAQQHQAEDVGREIKVLRSGAVIQQSAVSLVVDEDDEDEPAPDKPPKPRDDWLSRRVCWMHDRLVAHGLSMTTGAK